MKIYNLPDDKDFSRDIMNDLKRAKAVVLISPFLSLNVIKEWRELFKNRSNEDFTIVYDIDEASGREEKGLHGEQDGELIASIKWKRCETLHSKIYYFEFEKGYSFYHGSANLTNRGVGNKEKGNGISRNIEIMSRITGDISLNRNIHDIIACYNEKSVDEVTDIACDGCLKGGLRSEELSKRCACPFGSRECIYIICISKSIRGHELQSKYVKTRELLG